ncbi:AtzE family amidohydrolase [Hydrogenophaga sp.]|uniref:AtzE family amidohydrolase n=1 Tax=Hydrogenophaga sp. TaxID=1904254 RepID=UPI0035B43607
MSIGLTVHQIAQAVASGQRSAVQVLEEHIARIEATDPAINAFTSRRFAQARQQATAIDARRQRGEALGSLAGVPFAVKNLFDVAGDVTMAGSAVLRDHPPANRHAVLVERLLAADAVLLGSLNMDEFAYGFTTENHHHGATHNPHRAGHTAGGSSGGSGAAVAAAQVPLTLGSDTNGSIRVPASFCGVWGLKPTLGRLSRRGCYPFVDSLDHLGPLANDVTGLALTYDALQGPDPQDPGCHALGIDPTTEGLHLGTQGLRIGVLGGYFHEQAGPAARAAVEAAATALGARDEVLWPDAAQARAAAFVISASEGGSRHLPLLRRCPEALEPLSVDRFIAGALQPAAWYLRAQRFRHLHRKRVNALFHDWDVLLAPATPLSAPAIGTEWIDINGQRLPCRASIGVLTQPISLSGCPVVAAPLWPAGSDGLPIGVQLIAAPWREDLALRTAHALQASGVARLRPPAA